MKKERGCLFALLAEQSFLSLELSLIPEPDDLVFTTLKKDLLSFMKIRHLV